MCRPVITDLPRMELPFNKASRLRETLTASTDLNLLREQSRADDQEMAELATVRYRSLLTGKPADTPELDSRLQHYREHSDPQLAEYLIERATDAALRQLVINDVHRQPLLADVVIKDKDVEVKRLALARIDQRASLDKIITATRTTDKTIHKLAEARLQELRVAAGDPVAVNQRITELCTAVEALTDSSAEEAQLQPYENEWQQLAPYASKDLNERFERSRRIFQRLHHPEPVVAEPEPKVATVAGTKAESEVKAASSAYTPLLERAVRMVEGPHTPRKKNLLALRDAWKTVKAKPALSEQGQFDSLIVKIENRIANESAERKEKLDAVRSHLKLCREKLTAGEFSEARAAFVVADDTLDEYHDETGSEIRKLQGQLAKLYSEIKHLEGWQHYGNNRERRDLCTQMDALAKATDINVDERAKKVRAAQAEWKRLEAMEKSPDGKGTASPFGLWKRFQAAANRAWAPCQIEFDKQTAKRADRLAQIEKAVAELEGHRDNPRGLDASRLSELTRDLRRGRRDMQQMPRRETGKLSKRMGKILAVFEDTLDSARKRNEGTKRQLIQKARLLTKESDLRSAINDAKKIQRDWKAAGAADRKVDQELWEEFRTICDEIFARQKSENKERSQAIKEKGQKADALLKELKALAGNDEPDEAQLRRLQGQWDDLSMERDVKRHKAFSAEVKKIRNKRKQLLKAARIAALEQAAAVAALVAEVEMRAETSKSITQALQGKWDKAELPSGEQGKALKARWQTAADLITAGNKPDAKILAKNLDAARDLAIKLELAANLDSPAEDQQRRIALRVGQLSSALQEGQSGQRSPTQLQQDWFALGPVPHAERTQLETRITAANKALS